MKVKLLIIVGLALTLTAHADDDNSRLWLPQKSFGGAQITAATSQTPTTQIAVKELQEAWQGIPIDLQIKAISGINKEGYRLIATPEQITIISPSDAGLLYAAYDLLRKQAMEAAINSIDVNPTIPLRMLDHWDNLNGTIERGYAGHSLWQWDALPETLSDKYTTYARANASIGVNATVLNNVNASPQILSHDYLVKVKALADVFRPYNIKVFLSVNFASPMVLDGLSTADPKDKSVIAWWQKKVKEIYALVPDFGGFLVKANSEGQPGPCDYGRSHAEGANMLADALKAHGGVVIWRAFVYSANDADRVKQAYLEFKPLDGQFRSNVIVQVKNGPFDFQPREPYSPLFTGVSHTSLAAEWQITQEYLGQANHLIYLAPLWKEFFSFVAPTSLAAIAGVANTGDNDNWCGNTFAQSNWYAFGRLAWDPSLTAKEIANEWIMQTFSKGKEIVSGGVLTKIMLDSREALVDYMMPMGLSGLFAWDHHYGPELWTDIEGMREDWLPRYYHRADSTGVGVDRTAATGTGATTQYPDTLAKKYENVDSCPEENLLWFHHVAWDYRLKDGQTLWESLCRHYQKGIDQVRTFQREWEQLKNTLPAAQYEEGETMLMTEARDAVWWKDACLQYFQQHSKQPLPADVERPIHKLQDLQEVHLPITNYESPSPELLNKHR